MQTAGRRLLAEFLQLRVRGRRGPLQAGAGACGSVQYAHNKYIYIYIYIEREREREREIIIRTIFVIIRSATWSEIERQVRAAAEAQRAVCAPLAAPRSAGLESERHHLGAWPSRLCFTCKQGRTLPQTPGKSPDVSTRDS